MDFDFNLTKKEQTAVLFMSQVRKSIMGKALDSKLSQQQIADRLGIDKGKVKNFLRGKINLSLRELAELCWALGCEPYFELLEKEGG